MRRVALFCVIWGLISIAPTFAQDNQLPTAPTTACASSAPERSGVSLATNDRLELVARGLEAAESAKMLLLDPEALHGAQWCLEEDAVARTKSMNHWRNVASEQAGAVVDRLENLKGDTTIYLIRVAKGATVLPAAAGSVVVSNYAVIIDQPNDLVIAGYFIGQPNTEELLAHLVVRGRITKANGKTTLSVAK